MTTLLSTTTSALACMMRCERQMLAHIITYLINISDAHMPVHWHQLAALDHTCQQVCCSQLPACSDCDSHDMMEVQPWPSDPTQVYKVPVMTCTCVHDADAASTCSGLQMHAKQGGDAGVKHIQPTLRIASNRSPASRLAVLPAASSQSNCMAGSALTPAQLSKLETSTSWWPLGSTWEHRERSTAGSARCFSGAPTIRPCTLRDSLSLAPALTPATHELLVL